MQALPSRQILLALLLGAVALAPSACDRGDTRAAAPTDPDEGDISVAAVRELAATDPLAACEHVAHHAEAVIGGYFANLTRSLPADQRDDWMADIGGRFDEESLTTRCHARGQQPGFVQATSCVAGARTFVRIMQCNLWQPGAA